MKNLLLSVSIASLCLVTITACGGGGGTSATPTSTTVAAVPPPPPPPATSGSVTISGAVTFDLVPFNTTTNGLDYDNITQAPVRGVTIEALGSDGAILAMSQTDDNGNYALTVEPNTDVQVRALSEIVQTGTANFNVAVVDNTNDDSVYAVQGALVNSGAVNSVRNLNAESGWDGTSYSGTRAAGPFAVLDPIYETVTDFIDVAPDASFPAVLVGWSPSNVPVSGDSDIGEIGTSSYVGNGQTGMIFILGAENNDTDEYDRHVITHEWGHYFEDLVSRADSIGGPHSLGLRLDARLAMSEGFGNALSAIILDDTFYRDSGGFQQTGGFDFDVENNNNFNAGWFSEGSVQSIIYDFFDDDADGVDNIALGLGPIYEAFTSSAYINQATFTTIFSFVEQMRVEAPGNVAGINAIVSDQSINGTGFDGSGETNDGANTAGNNGVPTALPVHQRLIVDGPALEVCSVDTAGSFNRLGNRIYVEFDVPTAGSHTITATRVSGPSPSDPDIFLFRRGQFLANLFSGVPNSEVGVVNLLADDHVLEINSFFNVDDFDLSSPNADTNDGDFCFDLTVESN